MNSKNFLKCTKKVLLNNFAIHDYCQNLHFSNLAASNITMEKNLLPDNIGKLTSTLDGELKTDLTTKIIYSTDASAYKEEPCAVAWPKNRNDIKKILEFAVKEKTGVITRAAGTSLAGQVVGSGIVMDISRYFKETGELNQEEMWIWVEPGVVLDELNKYLKKYGLFFGPETSTSNRCNIGGMAGNNACGSHSLIYGSTREHVLEIDAILSDGSEVRFKNLTKKEFEIKCQLDTLEGRIYRNIRDILGDSSNRERIIREYPDKKIPRRNTGYALDMLIDNEVFNDKSQVPFNFSKLICGSEGTLAVITRIKLNLVKLPSPHKVLVCIHLKERNDAFMANLTALKHSPAAVEMMDDRILKLTENNISQRNNRFFVEGQPGSIVIVELVRESAEEAENAARKLIEDLKKEQLGYSYPVIRGADIPKVWELRKAGLGVLANMKGDPKPVSLIEDTAIDVEQLPHYINDFEKMLSRYGKDVVYHAHIGTGELHIRPVLNLKDKDDVELFRTIGLETAKLVKKYRGSLSGEHGDGRLRGEFIPLMIGEENYNLLKEVKKAWDPENILNPGKITDTPKMNTFLRYEPGWKTPEIETIFDFSDSDGIIRAAEKCNGSGDCRKTSNIGGTMCPTFMATGEEKSGTRARANVIRELLSSDPENPWDHKEIYEILDLCISCKGCKSECPSGVDIAKLKAEFLQHWYDKHGIPFRSLLIANITRINQAGSIAPGVFNYFAGNKFFSGILKQTIGFAKERSIPLLGKTTLRKWMSRNLESVNPSSPRGNIYLFIDEFTNYNDTETGIAVILLLTRLGYRVSSVKHSESGRTFLSKGLIRKAKKIARKNISLFTDIVNNQAPLVGIEPSAILAFRDEYPELCGSDLKEAAGRIAENTYTIEEFLAGQYKAGNIPRALFTESQADVLLHAHCQQKAISSSSYAKTILSIPANYNVKEIPSGCCGMAGSFGYEKEHYDLSNAIGELVLFPEVRQAAENTIIAAPGTSCRHHIKDGTGKIAKHPAVILFEAML